MEGLEGRLDIIFDLDDTLVNTGEFYRKISEQVGNWVVEHINRRLEDPAVQKITLEQYLVWHDEIDTKMADDNPEFQAWRYPLSHNETYLRCCQLTGLIPDKIEERRVYSMADRVYDFPEKHRLIDGALTVIKTLKSQGHRLHIYSWGKTTIQQDKIRETGIGKDFDQIHVVPVKDKNAIKRIVAEFATDSSPEQIWVIGDSLRKDILPAVQLGYNAIHIGSKNGWSHDHAKVDTTKFYALPNVVHVPALISCHYRNSEIARQFENSLKVK